MALLDVTAQLIANRDYLLADSALELPASFQPSSTEGVGVSTTVAGFGNLSLDEVQRLVSAGTFDPDNPFVIGRIPLTPEAVRLCDELQLYNGVPKGLEDIIPDELVDACRERENRLIDKGIIRVAGGRVTPVTRESVLQAGEGEELSSREAIGAAFGGAVDFFGGIGEAIGDTTQAAADAVIGTVKFGPILVLAAIIGAIIIIPKIAPVLLK